MLKRHATLIALVIAFAVVGTPVILALLTAKATDEQAYDRVVEACQRGIPSRVVQYSNTLSAIRTAGGVKDYASKGNFLVSKAILLTTPGVDPETGVINCYEVVEKP